jgi:hypothetical protein
VNFAWSGYMVELLRNVTDNSAEPLPNWDNFGQKFMNGLILVVVGFVYALPIILLTCLPIGVLTIPAILSGNGDLGDAGQAIMAVGGFLSFCLFSFAAIYGLVLSVIYPAILVIFSREGTFASCFKLREVFDLISKNAGPFFTAWGISLVGGLAVGFISGIVQGVLGWIPCIGWLAAFLISIGVIVYISTVYAHLFGQFGNVALGSGQQMVQS